MLTPTKPRHFCRNPRCRSKLPEPVENPHAAFCTKGCWQQYHRSRCCVCERPIEQPKRGGERRLCKRRVCRLELDKWPARYLPFGQSIQKHEIASRNADKTALSLPRSLRHWHWQKMSGEDHDYELIDGKGKMVARIRQEGTHWWVSRPRMTPEPPLETLDQARSRAISVALAALPLDRLPACPAGLKAAAENPAAIFQRNALPMNLLGGHQFDDAPALDRDLVKTITRTESRLCEPLPFVPSPGIVPAAVPDADDPLAIPQFLIRQAAVT
jgi:hypothetical protein